MRDGAVFEEPTPFGEFNFNSVKVIKVLAWLVLRRSQPELTLEAMGKTKMISFREATEAVPDTGPPAEDGDGKNDSAPAGSGAHLSVASIPG